MKDSEMPIQFIFSQESKIINFFRILNMPPLKFQNKLLVGLTSKSGRIEVLIDQLMRCQTRREIGFVALVNNVVVHELIHRADFSWSEQETLNAENSLMR